MKEISYLYPGFKHVGYLPSVAFQRTVQRRTIVKLLKEQPCIKMLSIGCGYGEELNHCLMGLEGDGVIVSVMAVDVAAIRRDIFSQSFANQGNIRLSYEQLNLFNLYEAPGFGCFDIVQCGFVLHDVESNRKQLAFDIISKAVRPGGQVIISDIFVSDAAVQQCCLNVLYTQEVENIYGQFLYETQSAYTAGLLCEKDMNELLGNGQEPGLLRTSKDAISGNRDFFDSVAQTVSRMRYCNLDIDEVIYNPHCHNLAVLVSHRSLVNTDYAPLGI